MSLFGPINYPPKDSDPLYMAYHFTYEGEKYFIHASGAVESYFGTGMLGCNLHDDILNAVRLWATTNYAQIPAHEFLNAVFSDEVAL